MGDRHVRFIANQKKKKKKKRTRAILFSVFLFFFLCDPHLPSCALFYPDNSPSFSSSSVSNQKYDYIARTMRLFPQ